MKVLFSEEVKKFFNFHGFGGREIATCRVDSATWNRDYSHSMQYEIREIGARRNAIRIPSPAPPPGLKPGGYH
jgi:hypothetical protein